MQKFVTILIALCLYSCSDTNKNPVCLEGRAQGTMYRITIYGGDSLTLHKSIDSIFNIIDNSLSLYNDSSVICRINRNETSAGDYHFIELMKQAIFLSQKTGGMFDFTIGNIVQEWNRAKKLNTIPDSAVIDSLLEFTGIKFISVSGYTLIKTDSRVMVDLNAIAQGYTVDVIAGFLQNHGIENFIIELGGEVKAMGTKSGGTNWTVGIEKPPGSSNTPGDAVETVELTNEAAATSGSYRQFYKKSGRLYSHIINPKTGMPAENSLLSVTIITKQCAEADALATAFMAMGLEQSLAYLQNHKGIKAFFIYTDSNGKMRVSDKTKIQ